MNHKIKGGIIIQCLIIDVRGKEVGKYHHGERISDKQEMRLVEES